MIYTILILIIYIIYNEIRRNKMAGALDKLQEFANRISAAQVVLEGKINAINIKLANSVSEEEIIAEFEQPVASIEAKINEINPEQ